MMALPNPFLSEIPPAGSPAPSVPLLARGAGGVSPFVLDEVAFMAAVVGWTSNSVVANAHRGAPAHTGVSSLDLAAVPSGAAALFNSNPSSAPAADSVTVAGLAVAPKRTASAAVTTNLDSEKNIATLRALAAIDTASAETSSSKVRQ